MLFGVCILCLCCLAPCIIVFFYARASPPRVQPPLTLSAFGSVAARAAEASAVGGDGAHLAPSGSASLITELSIAGAGGDGGGARRLRSIAARLSLGPPRAWLAGGGERRRSSAAGGGGGALVEDDDDDEIQAFFSEVYAARARGGAAPALPPVLLPARQFAVKRGVAIGPRRVLLRVRLQTPEVYAGDPAGVPPAAAGGGAASVDVHPRSTWVISAYETKSGREWLLAVPAPEAARLSELAVRLRGGGGRVRFTINHACTQSAASREEIAEALIASLDVVDAGADGLTALVLRAGLPSQRAAVVAQ